MTMRILSICSRNILWSISKTKANSSLNISYKVKLNIPFTVRGNVYILCENKTEYFIHKFDSNREKVSCVTFTCSEGEVINILSSPSRHYLNNITRPYKDES